MAIMCINSEKTKLYPKIFDGIDFAHIYHIVSQAKEFEESNRDHISVQWYNDDYRVACPLSNNKLFDTLEKAVKMLMLHEKEGLPVKCEWFHHLPIYNKEVIPIEFKEQNFPQ